jgi:hypothetical protein
MSFENEGVWTDMKKNTCVSYPAIFLALVLAACTSQSPSREAPGAKEPNREMSPPHRAIEVPPPKEAS